MRNADATRERILEAATAEFSANGIAGARVDRIAKSAGCNKNLIYIYFENKETLFTTVLQKQISRAYEEVGFTPEDLPAYAARLFDFARANPNLYRLTAWFALEQKADDPVERSATKNAKLAAMKKAQKAGQLGTAFPPGFLLTAVMVLATAWTAASPFGRFIDPDAPKNPADLRRRIVEAVRLLTEAKIESD